MQVYIGNDNVIAVLELKNAVGDTYVTNATVTAQVKNAAGTNIGGAVSLAAQVGSTTLLIDGQPETFTNGNYLGTLEEDHSMAVDTQYYLHIDVDAGSDLKAHWEVPVSAIKRAG